MSSPAAILGGGIAEEVLTYLRQRLGVLDLHYRQPLTIIPDGWETTTCRFQLQSHEPLRRPFADPLVLRAYSCGKGLPRLLREFEVQQHLFRRGFPVARPLLLEEGDWPVGGPFMIMEWTPGTTLLRFLLDHPLSIFTYPGRMAELQVRLNTLPVLDFPTQPGPHLSRSLSALERVVARCDFDGMAPGLEWLEAHQPDPPERPCILHLDFHPLNLLIENGQFRSVLDWSDADLGDYHADMASTLLLLDAAPVKMTSWHDWFASLPGKGILRRRYLRTYRRLLPIDSEKLNYYLAWAAFRRLATWGEWLYLGPEGTGIKPSATTRVTPKHLRFLARYFEKHADVAIDLPWPKRALPPRLNTQSSPEPA